MYKHIVLFNSKDKDLVEKCCNDVIKKAHEIPGLIHAEYRTNVSDFHKGYEQMGCMDFIDQPSFQAWHNHPLHLAIMEKLASKAVAIISFDYFI